MTTNALQAFYNARVAEEAQQATPELDFEAIADPIKEMADKGEFANMVDVIACLCIAPLDYIDKQHDDKVFDLTSTRRAQSVQDMLTVVAEIAVEMRVEDNDTTTARQYTSLPAVVEMTLRQRIELIEAVIVVYQNTLDTTSKELMDGDLREANDVVGLVETLLFVKEQLTLIGIMLKAIRKAGQLCR